MGVVSFIIRCPPSSPVRWKWATPNGSQGLLRCRTTSLTPSPTYTHTHTHTHTHTDERGRESVEFLWCSSYHVCLTRTRSPVRSRAETCFLTKFSNFTLPSGPNQLFGVCETHLLRRRVFLAAHLSPQLQTEILDGLHSTDDLYRAPPSLTVALSGTPPTALGLWYPAASRDCHPT